jgi:hypothetical protein
MPPFAEVRVPDATAPRVASSEINPGPFADPTINARPVDVSANRPCARGVRDRHR